MNMFKKNGGFTLVELIVVIAILAILAGIAVPAYSGYLKSAEKAGDITALSAVKTAAVASMATTGEVEEIVVLAEDGKVNTVMVKLVEEETDDATEESTTAPAETTAPSVTDGYTVLCTIADGTMTAEYDFDLYMNSVADLSFFVDGAQWTAAGGEWVEYEAPATNNAGSEDAGSEG